MRTILFALASILAGTDGTPILVIWDDPNCE
jgi:hypothetical protein